MASAAKSSRLTAAATRRAARTAADLVRLGLRDGRAMVAEQLRHAGFADDDYRVSDRDAEAYQRLAKGVLDKLADDQYQQLKRVVEQGLRDGVTDREIGARIHGLDLGLSKSHAAAWAATESTRFYNIGPITARQQLARLTGRTTLLEIVDDFGTLMESLVKFGS